MIGEPESIFLVATPVDMRRGIDGLSAMVQQGLGLSPCSGAAFIFRNKAGNRLRLVIWDGNGVWCCQRRLHRGGFIWPKVMESRVSLSRSQWDWLSAGVDWQRLSARPDPAWQV